MTQSVSEVTQVKTPTVTTSICKDSNKCQLKKQSDHKKQTDAHLIDEPSVEEIQTSTRSFHTFSARFHNHRKLVMVWESRC